MDASWWGQMSSLEHVYWVIATASSVLLLIQLVLAFVSGREFASGGDMVAHHSGDISLPHFQLLTIRNVVAFLVVFGWTGLAMINANASLPLTIIVSFVAGLVIMLVMAAMLLGLSRLQSSGNVDVSSAKGEQARVYLTVPAVRQGTGKLEVVVQGKKIDMDAVSDDPEPILTGTFVKIKDVINNQAIVERK